MDTYVLTVLLALFAGVVVIIAMLDRWRRAELAQFERIHQTLATCSNLLQSIHSSGEAQKATVVGALAGVQIAVEQGTKTSSDAIAALSNGASLLVEKATVRVESAMLQHQKAQEAASQSLAAKFSEATQSTSKELSAEAQRATKAVQDLQASLEASVKF